MTTIRVVQILNLIALLIAVSWLLVEPGYETVLASLTLVIALVGLRVHESKSWARDADRALFIRLREDLPSNGSIAFIDKNNFAGFGFKRARLEDLHRFAAEWNDAEHEFHDKEIERLRKAMLVKIAKFLSVIAFQTFPMSSSEWNIVPPEWEEQQPDRFKGVVNTLHETAGEIVMLHQDLFRYAKRKLGC